jgi:hypothetical protein
MALSLFILAQLIWALITNHQKTININQTRKLQNYSLFFE